MFLTHTSPSRPYVSRHFKKLYTIKEMGPETDGTSIFWGFSISCWFNRSCVCKWTKLKSQIKGCLHLLYFMQHWPCTDPPYKEMNANTCRAVRLKCHHENLFLLLHIMNLNFTRLEMKQLSVECKQQYLLKLFTWYIFFWLTIYQCF